VQLRLEKIYIPIPFQGHEVNVKVTAAKNGRAQVCLFIGRSLIQNMSHQCMVQFKEMVKVIC